MQCIVASNMTCTETILLYPFYWMALVSSCIVSFYAFWCIHLLLWQKRLIFYLNYFGLCICATVEKEIILIEIICGKMTFVLVYVNCLCILWQHDLCICKC